ncbi:sigma-70 family RNA polymerase sigma factor [Niameybacter massiliensis]|uniref:Sigma-70 family RNA polymerase sigma factor n=1 Tax=Holtiella tumoricola TaxID=3018743 RepID=A0AA42DN11_9FIRM|nr:sigma-70 family RNA polymerase sigma factor [Holtiella tumoricola]MDA3731653.1 sigma-70 family RNA polymerase sigma factor [Holtiella tumoricola]
MTNEELVREYQAGNHKVMDSIIKQNEKMVRKLVSKFYTDKINAIDAEDLYQEGCIGLMRACEKYDFTNQSAAKFIHYAVYWVYEGIYRYIQKNKTNEEISLNVKNESGEEEIIDKIIDDEEYFVKAEDSMYYKEVRKELGEALDNELTLDEKTIVKLHYGWDSNPLSIKELSYTYRMNTDEIVKINRVSLSKLRNSSWGRRERLYRGRY